MTDQLSTMIPMVESGLSTDGAQPKMATDGACGLTLETYTEWLTEIQLQPAWRAKADREMDYYAGNQLDADVLQRQRELGIPPSIEPLIGPTIDAVLGMEAKSRLDWRVTAEGDNDDLAQALSEELTQAERKSKADQACSEAYAPQVSIGVGWVEVSRDPNPFHFPYRCRSVHRNEIWWDWLAKEPDLSDARYLVRRKWMGREQAKLMFPCHADLIDYTSTGWNNVDLSTFVHDGGGMTGLAMSLDTERGWSIEEMEWRDVSAKRVCLFEVWYRTWEWVPVIKTPDGRVVEFNTDSPAHVAAVATGQVEVVQSIVSRVRMSWWLGPHKLHDGPSPYRHHYFPYVPFWGKREDRTGVPFALIRGMMYLQDEVNTRVSKMQWGLSAVRTIRTAGAVLMSDDELHNEVGRPDADIVLDPQKMQQGGVFKVERDFALNQQQFNRLVDCREGIKRVGGIYNSFMGMGGQAKSGVAIDSLVQQSIQTLADINDNYRVSRAMVGDLLLSLIIEDMAGQQKDVRIPATVSKDERVISLNVPTTDENGICYLDNDIERTMLKVVLADVPSTPTFRAQQLQSLSAAFQVMPPQYQSVVIPFLLALMDVPNKHEIVDAVKQASQQPGPEQIQQMIDQAVQQAMLTKMTAQRDRELSIKERLADKQAVKTGVESAYAAMQAGAVVASNPHITPIGDGILEMAAADPTSQWGTPADTEGQPPIPTQGQPPPPNQPMPGSGVVGANVGENAGMEVGMRAGLTPRGPSGPAAG